MIEVPPGLERIDERVGGVPWTWYRDRETGAIEPDMGPTHIATIQAVIRSILPGHRKVLEWGSGGSTKRWLDVMGVGDLLVSVESVPEWAERARKDAVLFTGEHQVIETACAVDYINLPFEDYGDAFGVIIVDGAETLKGSVLSGPHKGNLKDVYMRRECLMAALYFNTLAGTRVFMHDAQAYPWTAWALGFEVVSREADPAWWKIPHAELIEVRRPR